LLDGERGDEDLSLLVGGKPHGASPSLLVGGKPHGEGESREASVTMRFDLQISFPLQYPSEWIVQFQSHLYIGCTVMCPIRDM
jgi:hypothetical protein